MEEYEEMENNAPDAYDELDATTTTTTQYRARPGKSGTRLK